MRNWKYILVLLAALLPASLKAQDFSRIVKFGKKQEKPKAKAEAEKKEISRTD